MGKNQRYSQIDDIQDVRDRNDEVEFSQELADQEDLQAQSRAVSADRRQTSK